MSNLGFGLRYSMVANFATFGIIGICRFQPSCLLREGLSKASCAASTGGGKSEADYRDFHARDDYGPAVRHFGV
ncbi:hypothetical protein BDW74DRAFT_154187 [Aspergillus multicolor]|uniref:uncharacterized protein n=1 Tax=Aspergillus multicolor TaxID=41759 RepID=UPI003CCE5286